MSDPLEVRRFVVVSTAHVSEATAKMLDKTPPGRWPCVGGSYADYGWFVYVHDENAGERDQHIPDDLFAVMIWGRRVRIDYILFDCDGNEVADLPTFEW